MHINADRYQSPWQGRQESAVSGNDEGAEKTCREQILEKMAEMAKKVKDGTVEPTFQIGSMSYTMKEWDKLLEKFDAAEEALQAEVEAQIEEAEKQAAILHADAVREQKIREAQGEAEAVMMVQKALADSIGLLNQAAPSEKVLALKGLEAFGKAADGKATKIIIPSEIQGIAGLASALREVVVEEKK